jgi:hypothetical protein
MSLPLHLKPIAHKRVIDLVREAGLDVSPWSNFAGGPRRAAMNPKYCYEWAFMEPGQFVLINLWYADLEEKNGTITWNKTPRDWFTGGRFRSHPGRLRSIRLDETLQEAARAGLPVRVIIVDGKQRRADDPDARPSTVNRRLLDPTPWGVKSYGYSTGRCVLERGRATVPRPVGNSGRRPRATSPVATGPTTGPRPTSWTGTVNRNATQVVVTYALQFGKRNVWKIGHAVDVDSRLTAVNTHVPHEVLGEYWHIVLQQPWPRETTAHDMEQALLRALRSRTSVGERVVCTRKRLEGAWNSTLRRMS